MGPVPSCVAWRAASWPWGSCELLSAASSPRETPVSAHSRPWSTEGHWTCSGQKEKEDVYTSETAIGWRKGSIWIQRGKQWKTEFIC